MTMPPSPAAVRHHILDRGLHQLAALGGDLVDRANTIGSVLWSPPRVVVVGRLKAGKSTLVNALIGAPVAETAALEATNVVTVYQDGAPSRAEVVALDGTRRTVPITGPAVDLGIPVTDIAYVHRYLPSRAVANLALVDTPGLATLTVANAAATQRALIDGFDQTRSASVDADAVVFLFDSTPRADEVDFLRRLGFTPLNTVGVLSRADGFGEGAFGQRDPIVHAHEHARSLARSLSGVVSTVVPIAGLLAETSHTGRLTEADARALGTLAHLDPNDLFDVLDADDPAPTMDAPTRDRLLDLLGEYAMLHGRSVALHGAHALSGWLSERSGVAALRQLLDSAVTEFASLHRAGRILAELDVLAYSHPAREHVRSVTDVIRSEPAMAPVMLFGTLRGLLLADPDSVVVGELVHVLTARTAGERVGLDSFADPARVRDAASARLADAQRRTLSAATAAEDAALTELIRTYTLIRSGR